MELDLNHPGDFTQDSVQRLLAAGRARPDRLVVCRDGVTALASTPQRCDCVAFVIELDERNTSERDAPGALARRVFSCLRNNWPVPRDVYL